MPKILMPYTVHLDHTLRVTPVSTLFYKGDSNAHRFELNVLSKGLQADLSGCTAVYRFYRLQDRTVVSNPARIESGKVVAVLDKACYDYIGRFALTIAIQNGEDETTVFYGDGYMSGNRADTGITGDYVVYDVETLLAKIAEIDTAIANANTAIANANTAAENANAAEENANAAASSAQTATENANAATQASQTQQQAVAEAEAARGTAEQERATAEQARQETFAGYEERLVAATPDDTTVNGRAWTSKKTVDSLCMPIEATGNPVQVYPVEGYPLGIKVSWEPVQAGSGDPSPQNIRPITGRDAVSVTRCGRNLVEHQYAPGYTVTENGVTFTVNDDYSVTVKGTAAAETYFNFLAIKSEDLIATYNIIAMGKTEVHNGFEIRDIAVQPYPRDHITRLYLLIIKDTVVDTTYYPTIVYGSTATPYEPYTGSKTGIALPETVYGGTLDVETGVVMVEKKLRTLTGDEAYAAYSYVDAFKLGVFDGVVTTDNSRTTEWKCTHFPSKPFYETDYFNGAADAFAQEGGSSYMVAFRKSGIAKGDVDAFKAWIKSQYDSGTPVQFWYELKTPYTIQLTPHQIAALSGVNTLYTNAGTLTVTGREDPRHTIVTLTDRIAALESAAAGV